MAILIGVDEAGYGPNLGPLVIAATAWEVRERSQGSGVGGRGSGKRPGPGKKTAAALASTARSTPPACDLYSILADAVVRSPSECARRVAIADSKALYKPGSGLRLLERGVLAAVALASPLNRGSGTLPAHTMEALVAATCADVEGRRCEAPWHGAGAAKLPCDATADDVTSAVELLETAFETCGVRLVALRARMVFPAEFNDLVAKYGTKGAALSHVTLALVREVVDGVVREDGAEAGGSEPTLRSALNADLRPLTPDLFCITLDKHGGRNRYAGLVQHHFDDCWIDVIAEGRAASVYSWEHRGAPLTATFRVGGEAELPTALASMTAKYHRELAMKEFNAFWTTKVPGLAPTAGYPLDARRFKADIAAEQARLGIEDHILWRSR